MICTQTSITQPEVWPNKQANCCQCLECPAQPDVRREPSLWSLAASNRVCGGTDRPPGSWACLFWGGPRLTGAPSLTLCRNRRASCHCLVIILPSLYETPSPSPEPASGINLMKLRGMNGHLWANDLPSRASIPIGFPRPPKGYPLAWLVSRLSVQSGDTRAVNPRTGQDMGNRLGGQHAVAAARSQAKIPRGACWRHSCRAPSTPTGCAEPSVLGTGGTREEPQCRTTSNVMPGFSEFFRNLPAWLPARRRRLADVGRPSPHL